MTYETAVLIALVGGIGLTLYVLWWVIAWTPHAAQPSDRLERLRRVEKR